MLWKKDAIYDAVDLLAVSAQRVADGLATKKSHTDLEFVIGLNANPHGLLREVRLRELIDPTAVLTWDWAHTILQAGVMTIEMSLLLKACEPRGISRATMQAFLKDPSWSFPRSSRQKSLQLHRIFDERRVGSNDEKLRCSISELLGVYSLVRHYVDAVVGSPAAIAGELASFRAACQVLDVIVLAKRGLVPVPEAQHALARAVPGFLRAHIAVYGTSHLVPKHHWLLDIPPQLGRDAMVLDCFVVERTHLVVKRTADQVKNLQHFETAVLRGVTNSTFASAAEAVDGDHLQGPCAPMPGFPMAHVADKMRIGAFEVSIHDIVLRGPECGTIAACVSEAGQFFVIVDVMAVIERIGSQTVRVRPTTTKALWQSTGVEHVAGWKAQADGSILVVRL